MSSFNDTSNWNKKDGTTLVYSYEVDGKQHDGSSEKKPNRLSIQLERLSFLNTTSWEIKRQKEPEEEADFSTYNSISALGILDNCRLHAITLDETKNEFFTRLHVEIHPIQLEKLQKTGTVDTWSIIGSDEEKPRDGWMCDEIGSIHYYGADEWHDSSWISASVFLTPDKFEELVRAIKAGDIRTARMEILADVFEFGYESLGAGMRGNYYNYAILCEDEGESAFGTPKGASGQAKARLQEVLLEWSPKLDTKTAGRRDESDEDDYLEPEDMEPLEKDIEKVVARLARDVQAFEVG